MNNILAGLIIATVAVVAAAAPFISKGVMQLSPEKMAAAPHQGMANGTSMADRMRQATSDAQKARTYDALGAEQTEETKQLIADYLIANPEVIVAALTAFEERQQAERQSQIENTLVSSLDNLVSSGAVYVAGNPSSNVTLLEFFDYNCGYCKASVPTMMSILERHKDIRVVFAEYPFLAPTSDIAARASMASVSQGKFIEFHRLLMEHRGAITPDAIFQVAKTAGLDLDKLRADMNRDEIVQRIASNREVGGRLGFGTPAFLVMNKKSGYTRFLGGFDQAELERMILEGKRASG